MAERATIEKRLRMLHYLEHSTNITVGVFRALFFSGDSLNLLWYHRHHHRV